MNLESNLELIKAIRCKFCGRLYAEDKIDLANAHIKICVKNPDALTPALCVHAVPKIIGKTTFGYRCKKTNYSCTPAKLNKCLEIREEDEQLSL